MKYAIMTDIHFGRRMSSQVHNQDCIDFVDWFCDRVVAEGCTHIAFLGDWFESRANINIGTLEYSYRALKRLNSLGLPIRFCVGNHDLHRRSTREIYSTNMFNEFANVTVVADPTVIDGMLFLPYLFDDEYPALSAYSNIPVWMGHLEFKGFNITGYNMVLDHGPDHGLFFRQRHIFCGHFHKRQARDNVVYIGNCFPMDHGDAGDLARGMCIYDVGGDVVEFIDWDDCPRYEKVRLSDVLAGKWNPTHKKAYVKCIVDVDISYSEAQAIKDEIMNSFQVRDFKLEENGDLRSALTEGDDSLAVEEESMSLDEIVVSSIKGITDIPNINVDMLTTIYTELKPE